MLKNIADNAVVEPGFLTPAGLEAFLAGPYVKGVGRVYAHKLADLYGMQLLQPDFDFNAISSSIPGFGQNKVEDLRKSIAELKVPLQAALLLYSAGMKDVEVEKILAHYGGKAAAALTEDPYDMVENVWKTSFFTADKLGRWLGISRVDPRRIRGALLTAVKFYAEKGHLYATEQQALSTAANLTGAPEDEVRRQLHSLVEEERLVFSHGAVYLPVYYRAEKEAAEKIALLIRRNTPLRDDYEIPAADIAGNPLTEEQRMALETVMTHPVSVITGGPGTGKTTTVRGIIQLFEGMGKKVILVAPTGRAAKRLSDLAGAEAKTIHRLLGYNMGRGYRNKRFSGDILVVDEASMLEQVLFNHLLQALHEGSRIVLVGDTGQLPPIGAGDVLNDLISSGAVPVVTLHENFRQRKGSAIAATAEAVKSGRELPSLDGKDFLLIKANGVRRIHDKLMQLVGEVIPEEFCICPKDIQVVTPQKDGPLGARQLNVDLQQRVNPDAPEIKRGTRRFRLGDRVMQKANSAAYKVFNGETGWISDVDVETLSVEVTFHDGKKIHYPKERLRELELAYAVTVHKLQGSETDYMVMLLTSLHRPLLYRNLLYTGISRARRLCVLLGEEKAIDAAVKNISPAKRNSNFRYRLLAAIHS